LSGVPDDIGHVLLNDLFAMLYFAETMLRLYTERCSFFTKSLWRSFNLVMSISYLCQAVAQHAQADERGCTNTRSDLTFIAMFRILRLFQLVSLTAFIRNQAFFKELRCMVYSLSGAMWSFMWSSLVVFTIMLMFGLFFTNATINYLVRNAAARESDSLPLRENFGTLTRTLLSLFQALTGECLFGFMLCI
jgi:Ion transport protein.